VAGCHAGCADSRDEGRQIPLPGEPPLGVGIPKVTGNSRPHPHFGSRKRIAGAHGAEPDYIGPTRHYGLRSDHVRRCWRIAYKPPGDDSVPHVAEYPSHSQRISAKRQVDALRAYPEGKQPLEPLTALERFSNHAHRRGSGVGGGRELLVVRCCGGRSVSRDLFALPGATGLNDIVVVPWAREVHLAPADVRGGTFTISNHGVTRQSLVPPRSSSISRSPLSLGIRKARKRRPVLMTDCGEGPGRDPARLLCHIDDRPIASWTSPGQSVPAGRSGTSTGLAPVMR